MTNIALTLLPLLIAALTLLAVSGGGARPQPRRRNLDHYIREEIGGGDHE